MTKALDPGTRSIASATPPTSRSSEGVAASASSPLTAPPIVASIIDPTITDRMPALKRDPGNTDHQIRLALITLRSNPQARSISVPAIDALRSQANGGYVLAEPVDQGDRMIQPFLDDVEPIGSQVGAMPYPALNTASDDSVSLARARRVDYWSRLLCVLLDTQASHSVRNSPVP